VTTVDHASVMGQGNASCRQALFIVLVRLVMPPRGIGSDLSVQHDQAVSADRARSSGASSFVARSRSCEACLLRKRISPFSQWTVIEVEGFHETPAQARCRGCERSWATFRV